MVIWMGIDGFGQVWMKDDEETFWLVGMNCRALPLWRISFFLRFGRRIVCVSIDWGIGVFKICVVICFACSLFGAERMDMSLEMYHV